MKQGINSIQKTSILVVVMMLLASSGVIAAVTNFDNDGGDSRYLTDDNWSKGYPDDGDEARIRYGNHAIIDDDITKTNVQRRYNLAIGWQGNGSLTVEKDCFFQSSYKKKVWVGGDNNSNNNIKTMGILNLYGHLQQTGTADGIDHSIVLGFGTSDDHTANFGYVNVYDGGFLEAKGIISIVKGELRYEAGASSSNPRRDFLINKDGTVTFETNAAQVATVVFGSGGRAKLNLVNNATSKVKMELSGAFNIGDTWRIFDKVHSNAETNSTPVYSDQGYTFQWLRTVKTVAGHDGYVDVELVAANAVQLPRTLGTDDADPSSSRDVPLDGNIVWAAGNADAADPNFTFAGKYDVYFGTDPNTNNNPQVLSDSTETSYDPYGSGVGGDLLYSEVYYVRVDTIDANNLDASERTTSGGAWRFMTPRLDPEITEQPVDSNVNRLSPAIFSLSSINADGWQWYKDDVALVNGGNISGADSDLLTVLSAGLDDVGSYYCIVTSTVTPDDVFAQSNTVTLSIISMITAEPEDTLVDVGTTATFTVAGAATEWAWYDNNGGSPVLLNDGDFGGRVLGAATATLSIANCTSLDESNYYCVVGDGVGGYETTEMASLTMNSIITSSTGNRSRFVSESVTFTVTALELDGNNIYEWYRETDPCAIPDGDLGGRLTIVNTATTSAMTIASIEVSDANDYHCVVSNVAYNVAGDQSDVATLSMKNMINGVPENIAIFPLESATFTLDVFDIPGNVYEWYRSGISTAISGADSNSLSIVDADVADEGLYYCVVYNPTLGIPVEDAEESESAKLTIKRLIGHWDFEIDPNDIIGGLVGDLYSAGEDISESLMLTEPGIDDGLAATFDGSDYIRVDGSQTAYNFYPYGFTVSVWAKTSSTDTNIKLVSKQNPGGTKGYHIITSKTNLAGRGRCLLDVEGGERSADNISIATHNGNWHLITGTSDTKELRVYVDGNLEEIVDISGDTVPTHNYRFVIGANNQNGEGRYTGALDELKVYNYAVDQLIIAQEYFDVTGNSSCMIRPSMDMAGKDCFVNLKDFREVSERWLNGAGSEKTMADLAVMAEEWLDESQIVQ